MRFQQRSVQRRSSYIKEKDRLKMVIRHRPMTRKEELQPMLLLWTPQTLTKPVFYYYYESYRVSRVFQNIDSNIVC